MPYKFLEAMYKAVLAALSAEKIMHPFNRPAVRMYPASKAAITMTALEL